MASAPAETTQRPIRFWPAWLILALQLIALILTVTPSIQNGTRFRFMMAGPLVCLLLFLIWWFFAGRIPWRQSLSMFAVGLLVPAALMVALAHPSMGVALWIYGVPLIMATMATVLFNRRDRSIRQKVAGLLIGGLATAAILSSLRLEGFTGDYWPELSFRWAPTHESTLALNAASSISGLQNAMTALGPSIFETNRVESDWPSFRGPTGDSRVTAELGPLDWDVNPPRESWRIDIGPGWSSFAHGNGMAFTQEQRGELEMVTSYDVDTGKQVWQWGHPTRFDEVVSGAGPRSTPTLAEGRLFAYGARAALVALDASTGRLVWQRDFMAELGARLPVWGFSGSPLVVDGVVIIYAGGPDDKGLLGLSAESGELVWSLPSKGMNFSSAQRVRLAGRELALFADREGLMALDPASGETVWRFKPSAWEGPPMTQSQQIGEQDFIVPLGDGIGTTRIRVEFSNDQWQIEELWSSRALKPSFNDFVLHRGHLYGFDQNIFACVDAETGERKWKRGRYGFGQVLLMEQSSKLVILAEDGDVVLLDADPEEHREVARLEMLSGKTWNHPAFAEGHLLLRNGQEAVALDLLAHRQAQR